MRARTLKPEFFNDKKIGQLGPMAALVFQALWCMADDGGVSPCEPEVLNGQMFVWWPDVGLPEITEALRKLHRSGRITLHQGGDQFYAAITSWQRHNGKIHMPSAFRNAAQHKDFRAISWDDFVSPAEALRQPSPPVHPYTCTPVHPDTTEQPKGVRRSGDAKNGPVKVQRPKGETAPWMALMVPIWRAAYGGRPPKYMAQALRPCVGELGEAVVAERLAVYCAKTGAQYASLPKFAATIGTWTPDRGGAADDDGADDRDPLVRRIKEAHAEQVAKEARDMEWLIPRMQQRAAEDAAATQPPARVAA